MKAFMKHLNKTLLNEFVGESGYCIHCDDSFAEIEDTSKSDPLLSLQIQAPKTVIPQQALNATDCQKYDDVAMLYTTLWSMDVFEIKAKELRRLNSIVLQYFNWYTYVGYSVSGSQLTMSFEGITKDDKYHRIEIDLLVAESTGDIEKVIGGLEAKERFYAAFVDHMELSGWNKLTSMIVEYMNFLDPAHGWSDPNRYSINRSNDKDVVRTNMVLIGASETFTLTVERTDEPRGIGLASHVIDQNCKSEQLKTIASTMSFICSGDGGRSGAAFYHEIKDSYESLKIHMDKQFIITLMVRKIIA